MSDFENGFDDNQNLSPEELKTQLQATKEDLVKALAMVTETQNIASKAQDQYLNLKKEWDNFRKRNEEQKEQEKILANEKLVEELLPVLDDMERAYGHALEINDESPLKEGIKVIYDKFVQILSKFSVEQIDPFDEPFDANVHQAVSTQVDKTKDQDTVIGVIQKGYLMGTKVLRPAMVITSTKN
ncbi:MAG: nucleotide exchange factor GrpE [Clostridia bacterium]|nr:nucleotide exchange factor GrpE [Clostridia bacterium]